MAQKLKLKLLGSKQVVSYVKLYILFPWELLENERNKGTRVHIREAREGHKSWSQQLAFLTFLSYANCHLKVTVYTYPNLRWDKSHKVRNRRLHKWKTSTSRVWRAMQIENHQWNMHITISIKAKSLHDNNCKHRKYTLTIWSVRVLIYRPAALSGQGISTASFINMPQVRPTRWIPPNN